MTCQEIGEYIEQQQEHKTQKAMLMSSIGYRMGEMLILSNSMCVKKPKIMKFSELFPEFNNENNTSKEEAIENKWREFLGVVKWHLKNWK